MPAGYKPRVAAHNDSRPGRAGTPNRLPAREALLQSEPTLLQYYVVGRVYDIHWLTDKYIKGAQAVVTYGNSKREENQQSNGETIKTLCMF